MKTRCQRSGSGPRLPPKSDYYFLYQADSMKSRKQAQLFIANQPMYTLWDHLVLVFEGIHDRIVNKYIPTFLEMVSEMMHYVTINDK